MATEGEGTVMDAVNAALGVESDGTTADETETPAVEGADDTAPEGVEGVEGDAAESGVEGEAGTELADAEGADAGDDKGRERNPDGTFKAKPGEKPADDAAGKDAKGDKPVGDKKPADALNDPIPKDLKPATAERIRSLIKTTKEVSTERDTLKTDLDYIINGVKATGASSEQYGETLSWLAMFNSGDPKQQEKALELVETVADRLATLLGKERTVGDPLGAHPDLKDAVQKGHVTAAFAREMARSRNQSKFTGELRTAATTAEQQRTAAQQDLDTAKRGLTDLEAQLMATDPQYEAKKAALVPVLQPIFKALPPSQWVAQFQAAYKGLVLAGAAAPRKAPVNQPLRANKGGPSGGTAKAPASGLDVINAALASMK